MITFFIIVFILFMFSIFCRILILGIHNFYSWLQKNLFKKSKIENKRFISKCLIVNFRIYRILINCIWTIQPFDLYRTESKDIFHPQLNSAKTRRNVLIIGICFLLSILLYLFSNNIQTVYSFLEIIKTKNIGNRIFDFISINKWAILAFLSLIGLAYSVLKDKFSNKIISDIQDDELKNIIITHKNIYPDFIDLKIVLCKNIDVFLCSPKENGDLFILYRSIINKFSDFQYDYKKHTLKKEKKSYHSNNSFNQSVGYESIAEVITKINHKIQEFRDRNPFYETFAINKYIHGLWGIDISDINRKKLIDINLVQNICNDYPEHIIEIIQSEDYPVEEQIKTLNDLFRGRNDYLLETAIKTIEYVIEIENYINKFRKAFVLKLFMWYKISTIVEFIQRQPIHV